MDQIQDSIEGGILRIGFNRPSKKNAITGDMYLRLAELIEAADAAPEIRVIVLHGSETTFTSGNDVTDFSADPTPSLERPSWRFMRSLMNFRKPVVAAVNGPAVGIGATLLLHCDIVYAGDNVQIQYPFVKLALCPEFASSILLPAVVGRQRAAELFLLGEPCPAQTAYSWGLVNEVIPPQDTLPRAMSVAQRLAQMPPESVRVTKSLMRDRSRPETADHFELELEHFRERLNSPEAKEAFKAFEQRRSPDFSSF